MAGRFTLKIGDHLESAETKRYYNEKVFSEIAPRYDFITRTLSFGQDAEWKRRLLGHLPPVDSPFCLDLACGTGDIAFLLADKYPKGRIIGMDIAEPMLAVARRGNVWPNAGFIRQDIGSLPFRPETADIITGGYALRNAPDLEAAMDEIHRVLKPNGIAAFLDFSKPSWKFLQAAEYGLLKAWAGFWGVLLHGNHEVYGYIAESLRRFPDRRRLHGLFWRKGFAVISSELFFGGITELVVVRKLAHD